MDRTLRNDDSRLKRQIKKLRHEKIILNRMLRVSWIVNLLFLAAVIILGVKLFNTSKIAAEVASYETKLIRQADSINNLQSELAQLENQNYSQSVSVNPAKTTSQDDDELPVSSGYSICLDAGHGGSDAGSVGEFDGQERYEKDDTLALTLLVRDVLKDYGVNVILTREADEYLGLEERTEIANKNQCDAIISIHRNKYEDAAVSGVESWIYSSLPNESYTLSKYILEELEKAGISQNRGIKGGTQENANTNYVINSSSEMPSLILEIGFISSEEDNTAFDSKKKEYASAIADGIMKWLMLNE